jgi:hypothetical protein
VTAPEVASGTKASPGPQRWLVESPWANNDYLQAVVLADLFGGGPLPLTRSEAMRVPAVARARHVLCPTIARLPIRCYAVDQLVEPQPTWPQRTDGPLSPFHRMLWTVDDILFYGWSLWLADRGTDSFPLRMSRVPRDQWEFDDDDGVIDPDGNPYPADEVVLIPGPHEGILTFGVDAIRDAASLQRASRRTAESPVPAVELHQTNDAPMGETDIDALVARWVKARNTPGGGGVSYTPKSIELRTHGAPAESLLLDGRNGAAVDIARVVGIPAATIDATQATASLTYETQQGRNAELVDYGLAAYMAAISARLSMDDIVPRGQRSAFDAEELLGPMPGTTGAVTDD